MSTHFPMGGLRVDRVIRYYLWIDVIRLGRINLSPQGRPPPCGVIRWIATLPYQSKDCSAQLL